MHFIIRENFGFGKDGRCWTFIDVLFIINTSSGYGNTLKKIISILLIPAKYMRLQDFDYNLPKELIAQEPINPRDRSRMLALDKKTGAMEHKHFYDIVDYLKKGDVLVLNNSKVFPARLIGKKAGTGGKIEVFLLRKAELRVPVSAGDRNSDSAGEIWQCLLGGRIKEGAEIEFDRGLESVVLKNNEDGAWQVNFNLKGKKLMDVVYKIGLTPLPPYIKRQDARDAKSPRGLLASATLADKKTYQTVYADDNKVGSVAAPTAGFHFTPELMKKLKAKGAQIEYITLHVGLGTFAPVKVDDITKHKMHAEWIEVKKNVIEKIIKAKQEGGRVIAVGTTSARTLEFLAACGILPSFSSGSRGFSLSDRRLKPPKPGLKAGRNAADFSGWTDIFIYPGYEFKIVDGMITNFHLPKSTLLMLVSAFAGKKLVDKAYITAINKKYRFYSYGDAMLILND